MSAYLAWAALTSSPVAGCSGGAVFDCGHVLNSRWSHVLGVPVSVPAMLTHLAIIGLVVARPSSLRWQVRRWTATGFAVMAAAAAGLWFLGLQLFWIQHLCVYCVAAHACALLAAGALWWSGVLRGKSVAWAGGTAAAALALLVTVQASTAAPPSYQVIEHAPATAGSVDQPATAESGSAGGVESGMFEAPGSVFEAPAASASQSPEAAPSAASDAGPAAAPKPGQAPSPDAGQAASAAPGFAAPQWSSLARTLLSPASLLTAQVGAGQQAGGQSAAGASGQAAQSSQDSPRLISVLDGIKLNPKHWPIVGDPEAELVFAELLDYTCPHCRDTHAAMEGAMQHYGDRLAVLVLPVPLDRDCNPTVQSTNAQHAEACELAQLAIALWRVDPEQFESFHDYLFESQPTYAQARARANQLVDPQRLQAELSSSIPADYISKHIALYRRAGAGAIPKLMFPSATTVGEVGSADALIRMIQQRLVR